MGKMGRVGTQSHFATAYGEIREFREIREIKEFSNIFSLISLNSLNSLKSFNRHLFLRANGI